VIGCLILSERCLRAVRLQTALCEPEAEYQSVRLKRYLMARPIIILCGIPGSGKSAFGAWLQRTKGWLHVDMENGDLRRYNLDDPWNAFLQNQGSTRFVDCLIARAEPVALDWGFPVTHLAVIGSLKAQEVVPWWFTGDRLHARESYLQREMKKHGRADPRPFDCQYAAISLSWFFIAPVFEARVIRAIGADGKYLSSDDIYRRIAETDSA
jgi:hypothetical protein